MSLFFDDEIQKVKKKTDRTGLDNLMSQDPRDNPGRVSRYRGNSRNQTFSSRDQYDSYDRQNSRSNSRSNNRRNNKY